mmetsp:Transcript_17838/g.28577  ORF Transcript_17838/g.28577 Transcript_17838/m.28577 type:complete len:259 (+) Transcript_17838:25-801(+)
MKQTRHLQQICRGKSLHVGVEKVVHCKLLITVACQVGLQRGLLREAQGYQPVHGNLFRLREFDLSHLSITLSTMTMARMSSVKHRRNRIIILIIHTLTANRLLKHLQEVFWVLPDRLHEIWIGGGQRLQNLIKHRWVLCHYLRQLSKARVVPELCQGPLRCGSSTSASASTSCERWESCGRTTSRSWWCCCCSCGRSWGSWLWRDSTHEVLDRSFWIVEGCPEASLHIGPCKAHVTKLNNGLLWNRRQGRCSRCCHRG